MDADPELDASRWSAWKSATRSFLRARSFWVADPHLTREAQKDRRPVRVALLELELAGRVEYSGDRVALRTTANEIWAPRNYQSNELFP
jgi:hypothetical protein